MRYARRTYQFNGTIGFIIIAMLMSGCTSPTVLKKDVANKPKVQDSALLAHQTSPTPMSMKKPRSDSGSLWTENGSMSTLFINAKARKVGDIVTIKIVETSSASNKASTDTDRDTSLNVGLSNFFNLEERFPSTEKFFNPFSPVQSTYGNEFKGSGSTVRSGALSAFITARIIQILPNGQFLIEGNREVRVNNENQVITLTGMVRPRDINADNVIQSTYIADAKISYSGSGVVNDQQRPGWLVRILDTIWPF